MLSHEWFSFYNKVNMGKFTYKKTRHRIPFGISKLEILYLENDYGSCDRLTRRYQ